MLSLTLNRHLDRRLLAAPGLLGGCGPLPPAVDSTGATDGTAATDTAGTAGTEPTASNATTEGLMPTTDVTTGPPPECGTDLDCECGAYCLEGQCFQVHYRCYDDCCY
ncbi:MAG TPA: hypothetical protein VIK91_24450 [Nannocystis sp.]